MALKDKLPTFEKGSPNLGDQLRELLAVVAELCEAEDARVAAVPPADAPTDEAPVEGAKSAPEAPVAPKATAATKTTSAAATKAAAK